MRRRVVISRKSMRILIDRAWKKETYTISRLYIDGVLFCNSLEDKDRGIKQSDPIYFIRSRKIYSETAIPSGRYNVRMDVVSPKYSAIRWYRELCNGKMPRLENVPGFDGILIHPGSSALDSSGCILVGKNTIKGRLTQSKDTFAALYRKMKAAYNRGEKITIEIK